MRWIEIEYVLTSIIGVLCILQQEIQEIIANLPQPKGDRGKASPAFCTCVCDEF